MRLAMKSMVVTVLCICMIWSMAIPSHAAIDRQAQNSRMVNGYALTTRAKITGDISIAASGRKSATWATQAEYSGVKDDGKITTTWMFYTTGGYVIWNTGDQAGSGKITGGSRTVKGSKATAKGTVSVNGNSIVPILTEIINTYKLL